MGHELPIVGIYGYETGAASWVKSKRAIVFMLEIWKKLLQTNVPATFLANSQCAPSSEIQYSTELPLACHIFVAALKWGLLIVSRLRAGQAVQN